MCDAKYFFVLFFATIIASAYFAFKLKAPEGVGSFSFINNLYDMLNAKTAGQYFIHLKYKTKLLLILLAPPIVSFYMYDLFTKTYCK
jgi:hypothetical protein